MPRGNSSNSSRRCCRMKRVLHKNQLVLQEQLMGMIYVLYVLVYLSIRLDSNLQLPELVERHNCRHSRSLALLL